MNTSLYFNDDEVLEIKMRDMDSEGGLSEKYTFSFKLDGSVTVNNIHYMQITITLQVLSQKKIQITLEDILFNERIMRPEKLVLS